MLNSAGPRASRFIALGVILTFLFSALHIVNPPYEIQSAQAATSDLCVSTGGTAQNDLKAYPSHGKVFYIDSGQNQNVDAAYAGYRVENTSGSAKTNLWAKVDTFTGGVVGLANPSDAYFRLGDIGGSAVTPAFFLLQAGTSTTRAQSHVFRVYSGDPRLTGSSELYSCTYSFVSVKETIKAAANKVEAITSVSADQIGGNLVVTVKGKTGTIGSGTSSPDGEVLWFTPAARSSWPSSSLVLRSSNIQFASNKYPDESGAQDKSTHINQLVFQNPTTTLTGSKSRYYYVATYTFQIAGPVASSLSAVPIAQISSGTQIKHTDVESITSLGGSTLTVSTPVTVGVTKTVSSSISTSGSDRVLSYTVTLANSSSAVTLDQIVDQPSAGLTFKAGSARYNGSSIADPSTDSDGNLVFVGPISVRSSGSDVLTYQMISTCSSGSFSYTNTAYATIGGIIVGRDASSVSGVNIQGSCPPTTGTVTVSNQTLDPDATTQPASSIGETGASLNGSVDPNGVSGQAITFEWGTHPALVGASVENVGLSDTSTVFYAVDSTLSGLSSGTRYYYRVTIGDIKGDIVSFVTTEPVGTPSITTNAVTNIAPGSGSDGTATLNGTIDPNQVATTPSFTWGLTGGSGSETTCTNANYSLSGIVQEELDSGSQDASLSGAFATEFSLDIGSLQQNKYYCVKAVGTYAGPTVIEGGGVLFYVTTVATQTITFSAPTQTNDSPPVTLDTVGQTADLTASASSGLAVTYSSNTPEVCTVSGSVVTIVGGGICSVSADQSGNTSYYPATTATVSFTIPTFTLTYNLNGASGAAPVDGSSPYGKGATVTVTNSTPTRSGNSFTGWDTQADGLGTDRAAGATFTITSDTVLYAQWTPATTFSLTYSANGGSGAPASTNHTSGSSVTVSATEPIRSGYTFNGWNANSGGTGTNYAAGSGTITVSANTTLFAKWTARVTYSGNGSTSGSIPVDATNYAPGATVTALSNSGSLARTGYTFAGWNTQADGQGTDIAATSGTLTMAGAQTLYAKWTSQITYNGNGNTSGSAPSDGNSYRPGQTITAATNSSNLAKTNFVFGGWNTASNGSGANILESGTFANSGAQTLWALWNSRVSYDANPPVGLSSSGSGPSSTDVNPGQSATVGTRGTLAITGKVFDEWNRAADGSGLGYAPGDTFTPTQNVTLYAQWLDEVTVTFDGNGNTAGSAPSSQTVGQGRSATIPSTPGGFARTGYSLSGWNTLANGSGTRYTSGNSVAVSTSITLYAEWTIVSSGGGGGGGGGGGTPSPTVTITPGNSGGGPVTRPRPRVPLTPVTPPTVVTPPAPAEEVSPAPSATGPSRVPGLPGLRLVTPVPSTTGGEPSTPNASESPVGTPGGRSGFASATVDLGLEPGPVPLDNQATGNGNGPGVSTSSIGVRTVAEVAQEKLGGFAPGAGTILEILGARTAARFVVTEATLVDSFVLQRAIEESIPAQATNFFSIERVQPALQPLVPRSWSVEDRAGISEVFEASGLPAPRNLAELEVSPDSQWILVEAKSSTYAPGTEVYLTLTSEPIVLASAVVDRDGEAILTGTVPTELLTLGEHRIRLVGIRALDGAFVEEDGTVGITDELLAEIQRFDLGTQSTIAIYGENPDGASHTALRVIPLVPEAPWWTLWLILAAAVVGLLTRFIPDRRPRFRRIGSSALALGLAIPGVILGWLSTVVTVTWWALGLGLLGALLAALGPYRFAQERSVHSGAPDS